MSDKKSDMDEVRDLWNKEQDKKETAALNQAGEELFTGMRKPEHSTPIKPKPEAKPIFAEPGAPSVGNFSRKLFKEGGRKKRKSRKRKRKGGTSDLCKLYKDGIVTKAEANAYCAKFYLEDGTQVKPGVATSLRPANTCNDQGQCYREESEIDMMRAYLDRQAAASAGTGGTGGRRKTRRKKRKKKRKTKKRRKRKKRKTKKRYRNQRGCKR